MTTDTQTGGNGGKGGRAVIIVGIIIIILLLAVIAILLLRNRASDVPDETQNVTDERPSVRMVEDEESAEDIMNQMREEVREGMFECQMSMNWSFENGQAESKDAYVANSTNNTYPIYFDVYLDGTEELVYSSPVIPVGANLHDFALDKALGPGEYKATVMYTLIRDEESQEEISQAGFVITINVLN